MEYTRIDDFILFTAGFHFDTLERELDKSLPNRNELVKSFNEILDSVSTTVPTCFDHTAGCKCKDFLLDHTPWIFALENRISSILAKDVIFNEADCWMVHTMDKYRLFYQCVLRYGAHALY